MNKEYYMQELIKNSKYDAEWIKAASEILESGKLTLDDIKDLYVGQVIVLNYAIKATNKLNGEPLDINLKKLIKANLNASQMQSYVSGIENGVSEERMEFFLNPEIPYTVMDYGVTAMINNKDSVIKYIASGEYSIEQITEIIAGVLDGLDVSVYDDANNSSEIMELCRHALVLNYSVEIKDSELIIKTVK